MESKKPKTRIDKARYWQALIMEWEVSGKNQAAFCRARGLSYSNFFNWRQRLSKAGVAVSSPLFVPLEIKKERVYPESSSSTPVVMMLKNNMSLQITAQVDKDALRALLEVLGVLPC